MIQKCTENMYIGNACSWWQKFRISGVNGIKSSKNWLSWRCSRKSLVHVVLKLALLYSQELTSRLYPQQFKSSAKPHALFPYLCLPKWRLLVRFPDQNFVYSSEVLFHTCSAHLNLVRSTVFWIMLFFSILLWPHLRLNDLECVIQLPEDLFPQVEHKMCSDGHH